MLLPLKAVIGRKPRKDGKSVIYYQYCYSSTNRVLLSTNVAITAAFWNARRQCVSKSLPDEQGNAEALNKEIDRIKKLIEGIIEHGLSTGAPNIGEYVKGVYSPDFKLETLMKSSVLVPLAKREADFFKEIDSYIKSKERTVVPKGLANFISMRERLTAFEAHRKAKITFASLDYNFYTELIEFLTYDYLLKRKKTPEYGLKLSSIGGTIKKLRGFIRNFGFNRQKNKVIHSQ